MSSYIYIHINTDLTLVVTGNATQQSHNSFFHDDNFNNVSPLILNQDENGTDNSSETSESQSIYPNMKLYMRVYSLQSASPYFFPNNLRRLLLLSSTLYVYFAILAFSHCLYFSLHVILSLIRLRLFPSLFL